jgi:hypothetical protein
MTLPGTGKCHHCQLPGHWQADCPLLIPAENRKQHDERIAGFTRRFTEQEIGPVAKRKMIEKEMQMWKKEMAKK